MVSDRVTRVADGGMSVSVMAATVVDVDDTELPVWLAVPDDAVDTVLLKVPVLEPGLAVDDPVLLPDAPVPVVEMAVEIPFDDCDNVEVCDVELIELEMLLVKLDD